MSLNIEYLDKSFRTDEGSITVDDGRRGLYIRSYREDKGDYYISLSNDKPENTNNMPGSRQIGFFSSVTQGPIIENFVGRKGIIPIKITTD